MSFTAGMELVVDPKTAMELVWGATSTVWNFFSETGLQPSAAVWFTNCALYGGDSEGWTASLREAALIRPQAGFKIGNFKIGYAGKSLLPDLIDTEFGTRWLGILAVAATLPDEVVAGESLELFIKETASHAARPFLLNYQQCQILWSLSREIFCLSPHWYEFLRIAAKCLPEIKCHERHAYESIFSCGTHSNDINSSQKLFFGQFMKPAFEIWQLSQRAESRGKVIRARGYIGSAQLIFYLSVVCGLHVRLTSNSNGGTSFGEPVPGQPDVVVDLHASYYSLAPWEVSYLFEGETLGEAVTSTMQVLSIAPTLQPQGFRPGVPRSKSTFQIYQRQPVSLQTGELLLHEHRTALTIVEDLDIGDEVAEWFLSLICGLEYYQVVHNVSGNLTLLQPPELTTAQAMSRAERIWQAIQVFAPCILNKGHRKRLTKAFIGRESPPTRPDRLLMRHFMSDYDTADRHRRVQAIECAGYLRNSAQTVWMTSFVTNDPLELRDLGGPLEINSKSALVMRDFVTFKNDPRRFCSIDRILQAIAQRLANGKMDVIENCVGRVAGGFVTGLLGNEGRSVLQDPGFSIYFIPGTIAASNNDYEPDRRLTNIVQDFGEKRSMLRDPHYKVFVDSESELCSVPNAYKNPSLTQTMKLTSDTGYLGAKLEKIAPLYPVSAVDWASRARKLIGCLEPCIKGKLDPSQLARVAFTNQTSLPEQDFGPIEETIDPTDDRENWKLHYDLDRPTEPWHLKDALVVVPARDEPLIQRAIIADYMQDPPIYADAASPEDYKLALTDGGCVPCAVQRALDENMKVLIIC